MRLLHVCTCRPPFVTPGQGFFIPMEMLMAVQPNCVPVGLYYSTLISAVTVQKNILTPHLKYCSRIIYSMLFSYFSECQSFPLNQKPNCCFWSRTLIDTFQQQEPRLNSWHAWFSFVLVNIFKNVPLTFLLIYLFYDSKQKFCFIGVFIWIF